MKRQHLFRIQWFLLSLCLCMQHVCVFSQGGGGVEDQEVILDKTEIEDATPKDSDQEDATPKDSDQEDATPKEPGSEGLVPKDLVPKPAQKADASLKEKEPSSNHIDQKWSSPSNEKLGEPSSQIQQKNKKEAFANDQVELKKNETTPNEKSSVSQEQAQKKQLSKENSQEKKNRDTRPETASKAPIQQPLNPQIVEDEPPINVIPLVPGQAIGLVDTEGEEAVVSLDKDQGIVQFLPIPFLMGDPAPQNDPNASWLPVIPEVAGSGLRILLFALLVWMLSFFVGRLRMRLPSKGVFPWLLTALHSVFRFLILGSILIWLAGLMPSWLNPVSKLVLVAIAIALGWSARDILPDVISGLMLLLERRVRRGFWVSGEGFEGTVRRVGLRSTQLRDSKGHLMIVPNSQLLNGPMLSDTAVGAEKEVTMLMQSEKPASRIRKALHDAILLSPWVPPNAKPVVLRDPQNPSLWRIRTRLLEAKYAVRFEGELMERAEEILSFKPQVSSVSTEEDPSLPASNTKKQYGQSVGGQAKEGAKKVGKAQNKELK